MSTLTDSVDATSLVSSGGLVDASTAAGQVDEEADFRGVVGAMLAINATTLVAKANPPTPEPLRRGNGWRLPIR